MGSSQSAFDPNDPPIEVKKVNVIKFHLQGKLHSVNTEEINPNTSLNFYLRNTLQLKGTKGMCFEGGCGSCVVVLQRKDSITRKDVFISVNSCLIPLLSCNGSKIFTIEGIGNPLNGYHPVQEVLAQFNGTQCGFCSPGMVMNTYALYESGKMTMEQVEDSFSGNICRCTGYRPILSAFKSLCTDASPEILGECPDIEDFVMCYKERCAKKETEETPSIQEPFYLEMNESKWIKVYTLRDLLATLYLNISLTYKLVAGNTAQGVFPQYRSTANVYIDIMDVAELKTHIIKGNFCILGANITLAETIEFFNETAKAYPQFSYLKQMADHINLVANIPVRNRATLAGNLIMKHDRHDFPSDIFLLLETVGATLTTVNFFGVESKMTPLEFINRNINKQILTTITLVPYLDNVKFVSYKIMPRAQSVHAYVNAAFLYKFNKSNIIQEATVVFGNINPDFVHVTRAEKFLVGKQLFDNSVLQQVYQILSSEINPNVIPPDPTPKHRKGLAIALFYKGVLSICPSNLLSDRVKSGGDLLKRAISKGTQDFETNKSLYPLTQAIPKLEALAQCSGQAPYVIDIPDLPHQLFAALVQAKAPPNSKITKIDPSEALKREDVVAFFGRNDIPGKNKFTTIMSLLNSEEPIFPDDTIRYYDQPIGVLVGKSRQAVEEAVNSVQVAYQFPNIQPLLTIRQVLQAGRNDRVTEYLTINPKRRGNNIKHVIKGTFDIYHQYHFHMETQSCHVVPVEDGLDVYCSTQWMDMVQVGIADMLAIPQNKVHVVARRCGGGFGARISRAGLTACVTALAAWKLKQPVRIWLPLTTNITALGKRFPFSMDYEVGVDDKGVIQYLNSSLYTDVGFQRDEDVIGYLEKIFTTMYTSDTFTVHFIRVTTDTAVNTWARAPGSVEGLAGLENIIEHIAYELNLDPLAVRLANFSDRTPILKYLNDLKSWANIEQRKAEIETFNKQNRWKKKGFSIVPMSFDVLVSGAYTVTVSIFHGDGSVQISHGGVEIGQGINTKAAQVCAYKLGIPLEKVRVLPSNSFIGANNLTTGGSLTSEGVCYGVIQACDELLKRIKPYQKPGVKWEEVIKQSFQNYVNLVANGIYSVNEKGIGQYSVYGICATEVLVDILTGQHLVTRVDLIEDTGDSISPAIDIGQVEGAFIMGLGYYTLEKVVMDYEGKILTNNTWTYYPPGAKDIPIEFNIKFPKNNPNPVGVLKSKATGEPAICLAIGIPFAIKHALASARKDVNSSNPAWFPIDNTMDIENVFLNSLNDPSQYVL